MQQLVLNEQFVNEYFELVVWHDGIALISIVAPVHRAPRSCPAGAPSAARSGLLSPMAEAAAAPAAVSARRSIAWAGAGER